MYFVKVFLPVKNRSTCCALQSVAIIPKSEDSHSSNSSSEGTNRIVCPFFPEESQKCSNSFFGFWNHLYHFSLLEPFVAFFFLRPSCQPKPNGQNTEVQMHRTKLRTKSLPSSEIKAVWLYNPLADTWQSVGASGSAFLWFTLSMP